MLSGPAAGTEVASLPQAACGSFPARHESSTPMLGLGRSAGYRPRSLPHVPTHIRSRAATHVSPREAVSFARKRPGALFGVKAVGSFVPGLTRKAFEKYGFSAATPDHRLADHRRPRAGRRNRARTPEMAARRWSMPRTTPMPPRQGPPRRHPGAAGRMAAQALAVQYGARQIIERINAYFGYAAVAELRIVQAPVDAAPRSAAIAAATRRAAPDARGGRRCRCRPARRPGAAGRRGKGRTLSRQVS